VLLIPVVNLPSVSATLAKLVAKFAAGVIDTGGKPLVMLTPVANLPPVSEAKTMADGKTMAALKSVAPGKKVASMKMMAQQEKQAELLKNSLLFRLGRISIADFSLPPLMSMFSSCCVES
jgi:hypothetical protein